MLKMDEVGRRISALRKEKNMTQLELADRLGITYQAVSNWERGDSMPDIAKLEDLANIFEVTIDQIILNKKSAKLLEQVQEEQTIEEKVEAEDLANVVPLLKPKQVDRLVSDFIDQEEQEMDIQTVRELAPFLDEDLIYELLKNVKNVTTSDLVSIAPFMDEDQIGEILSSLPKVSIHELVALAPFASEEYLSKVALDSIDDEVNQNMVVSLAPFLSEEVLSQIVQKLHALGKIDNITPLAPFLDETVLSNIVEKLYEEGKVENITPLAPFMDEEVLSKMVAKEIKKGNFKFVRALMPFCDEDTVTQLLKKTK